MPGELWYLFVGGGRQPRPPPEMTATSKDAAAYGFADNTFVATAVPDPGGGLLATVVAVGLLPRRRGRVNR